MKAEEIISKYGMFCELVNNVTCCPPIKITELANGLVAETYTPDALVCPGGMFIPGLPTEPTWNRWLRLVFYGLFLAYCFLGVAIIADTFMVAIEVITSKQKTVHLKNEKGELEAIQVNVWNATISNLSLMALGSSAPEILLAVIETVTTLDQKPVEGLGPSCIVGSAAFNLLMISAICVIAIPDGESRKIAQFGVFNITAFFSVFAYIWMYYVLSDEVVTPLEAWLTFFQFFLLVGIAYGQDQKWIWCRSKKYKIAHSPSNMSDEDQVQQKIGYAGNTTSTYQSALGNKSPQSNNAMFTEAMQVIAAERGIEISEVDPNEVAEIVAKKINDKAPKSRAYYRIKANEHMTGHGSKKVARVHGDVDHIIITKHEAERRAAADADSDEMKQAIADGFSIFSWSASHTSVFENEKYVQLIVLRHGDLGKPGMVKFETSSGSAMAGVDFVHVQGMAKFPPGEKEFIVKVGIIDDNEYEPDENFYCRLYGPSDKNVIGHHAITEVTIINDDDPGQFTMEKETVSVTENVGVVKLWIHRNNGCDGAIELNYYTSSNIKPKEEDESESGEASKENTTSSTSADHIAKPEQDYTPVQGVLKFGHQEVKKYIEVPIVDAKEYDKSRMFFFHFSINEYPQCGAKYGDHKSSVIKIAHDVAMHKALDNVAALLDFNLDKFRVGTNTWSKQFADAVTMPGSNEEGEEPGCSDYLTHFLTFYWKVIFAFVPPTTYCSGYLTFFVSLAFIGVLTGVVGDVAGVFGCLVGLSAPVTAITFVALGTSLPDTFASKQAAEEADTADASIGNVTGSNSVNVFLGQGLPWVIATTYFLLKGEKGEPYIVKAGSLSFSVIVFVVLALVCIGIFYIRRFKFGGMLGGEPQCKKITTVIMACLWFVYIILSALQAEGVIVV